MYKCKGCGIEVIVAHQQIFKPCRCTEGIIAEASAITKGTGKVK